MVVNSAMDTKSLSRVEHVERVELWKEFAACKSKRGFVEVNEGLRP